MMKSIEQVEKAEQGLLAAKAAVERGEISRSNLSVSPTTIALLIQILFEVVRFYKEHFAGKGKFWPKVKAFFSIKSMKFLIDIAERVIDIFV